MSAGFSLQQVQAESQRQPALPGWLLLSPLLLWLLLFVIAPAAILLVYSFCRRDALGQVVYDFNLENYKRVFDPIYLRILWRSLFFAGLSTLFCLVIGYPVAYFIGKAAENMRNLLLVLVMIPFWTSFLIRTYAWITILKSEGLLNSLMLSTGLVSLPIEIMYTPAAVIIGLVYAYLPFMILPIYGSVEKLDNALVEAAMDLGAGPLRAFSTVILPLTWPGMVAGALLVFVPALGMFAITDLMGGARVPMVGNVIQNQFLQARDWPFGSALGVTLMTLFILVFWLCSRKLKPLS